MEGDGVVVVVGNTVTDPVGQGRALYSVTVSVTVSTTGGRVWNSVWIRGYGMVAMLTWVSVNIIGGNVEDTVSVTTAVKV